MEEWQLDFEWLQVRHWLKDRFKYSELPDTNVVLMLIGVQELGRWRSDFSKEEKQDLMHIGVCSLLSQHGYYEFLGRDEDGWPHYKQTGAIDRMHLEEQEKFLQQCAVAFFKPYTTALSDN